MSEGLHYEVKKLGVDVTLVEPGAFPTEIFHKTVTGSDESVNEQYGDIAKIPEAVNAGMAQAFEHVKPNPQMVPDAIFSVIDTPKGQRPLRTVADALTADFANKANADVKPQYDNFLNAFGLGELL